MQFSGTQSETLYEQIKNLGDSIPMNGETNARDWAAFFKALSGFLSMLLPVILPLFTEEKPE
jgi:hypothetical protein